MKRAFMKETVITGSKVDVSKTLISLNSRIYLKPNGGDPYTMKRRREKKKMRRKYKLHHLTND